MARRFNGSGNERRGLLFTLVQRNLVEETSQPARRPPGERSGTATPTMPR
jgi:hypothetical protein